MQTRGSNQRPSNNKMLALPLSHSRPRNRDLLEDGSPVEVLIIYVAQMEAAAKTKCVTTAGKMHIISQHLK